MLVQHTREELAILEASTGDSQRKFGESQKLFQDVCHEKRLSERHLELCREEITKFKAAEDAGESKHKQLQLKLQLTLQEAKDCKDEIARSQALLASC